MSEKPIKILLIDDEQEFVNTLAQRLEFRKYTATTAPDGQTGLDFLTENTFDIVLLDLMMPGIGGIETLKQLKRLEPDLPVILLTGHGSTKAGMEGMRLGAFDYLMKPLDINDLIQTINKAVACADPE